MKRFAFIIFGALMVQGLAPLVISICGVILTDALGCEIGYANSSCVVLGFDIGETLLTMIMMHWFAIIGIPIAIIGALGFVVLGVIHLVRRRSL